MLNLQRNPKRRDGEISFYPCYFYTIRNKWIINGAKNFITHGISSDVIVVVVRTGSVGDSRGVSAIIVVFP